MPEQNSSIQEKRPVSRKTRILIAVILLLITYIAGLSVCYGLGMSRLHSGDYAAAEKLLAFPAKNGFTDAKSCRNMCRLYNSRNDDNLRDVSYRIGKYKDGRGYSAAVRQEADRLLRLIGQESYELGLQEYRDGNYSRACSSFSTAADGSVDGALAWELLCEALVLSESSKYDEAFSALARARHYAATEELKAECDKANAVIETRKAEWEPRYLAYLKTAVPYEGMKEEYVMFTSIALTCSCRKNEYKYKGSINADRDPYHVYHFYTGGDEVFTVLCEEGEVTYVKDTREEAAKKNAATEKSKSSGKSSKKQSEDPFHASDYAHPEDFYDWHKDDFWDYEDAEDYWEEHK